MTRLSTKWANHSASTALTSIFKPYEQTNSSYADGVMKEEVQVSYAANAVQTKWKEKSFCNRSDVATAVC